MCGAVDLNKRFRDFAIDQLKDEHYLAMGGRLTIDEIVDSELLLPFEHGSKRSFSLHDNSKIFSFPLRGLRSSHKNERFHDNYFNITL